METEPAIEKSCSFTGHRDIPSCLYDEIRKAVKAEIKRLYSLGVRHFIAGGALGFDTICAEAVLDMKESLEGITLTLAVPCKNHDARWSETDKIIFSEILAKADETVYVSEAYTKFCMFKRNRYMVDNSLYCISFCTRKSGGSYYTVTYAHRLNREVTEISEKISRSGDFQP